MQYLKRRPWIGALALCAAIALVVGCGGDDNDNNGDGNGDLGNVKNGTWNLTFSSTTTGSGETCTGSIPETTVPYPLCNINDPGDVGGGGGTCDTQVDGEQIDFDCDDVMTAGGCTITHHTEGTGTFHETSINMTIMEFDTVSPASAECLAMAEPCTTNSHIVGTWLNANGCSTASGTVPLSRIFRNASRIIGTR
jgi:hypothetical protein